MNIIGVNHLEPPYTTAFTHDTSVALVQDGRVVAAVAEEKFTRIKHHAGFPKNAIEYVLKEGGISREDVDYVTIPSGQISRFRMFRENWREIRLGRIADHLLRKFDRKRTFSAPMQAKKLAKKIFPNAKAVNVDHQLSHAASTYRSTNWNQCLIISMDGAGIDNNQYTSGGVYLGKKGEIETLSLFPVKGSLGHFFGAITDALGFTYSDGEGKTMGLACYGNPDVCYDEISKLAPKIKGLTTEQSKLPDPQMMIEYGYAGMIETRFWHFFSAPYVRFLIKKYQWENVAAAAQRILEERLLELVSNAIEATGEKRLALAGGVFLNVKANKRIREELGLDEVFIYPNAGDGGTTVGSALEQHYQITGELNREMLNHSYLGPSFSEEEIIATLKKYDSKIAYEKIDNGPSLVADEIINGKVVGWFIDRAEWGPRALGARSVVADPRFLENKERINKFLKKRDWFMPFAPSMLAEKANAYLKKGVPSPFMIMAFDVPEERQNDIPAALHIDGTTRPQTVERKINPQYYDMIREFGNETGVPVILNTSFNKHGLPTLGLPEDAIEHLLWGCVDCLFMEGFLINRN